MVNEIKIVSEPTTPQQFFEQQKITTTPSITGIREEFRAEIEAAAAGISPVAISEVISAGKTQIIRASGARFDPSKPRLDVGTPMGGPAVTTVEDERFRDTAVAGPKPAIERPSPKPVIFTDAFGNTFIQVGAAKFAQVGVGPGGKIITGDPTISIKEQVRRAKEKLEAEVTPGPTVSPVQEFLFKDVSEIRREEGKVIREERFLTGRDELIIRKEITAESKDLFVAAIEEREARIPVRKATKKELEEIERITFKELDFEFAPRETGFVPAGEEFEIITKRRITRTPEEIERRQVTEEFQIGFQAERELPLILRSRTGVAAAKITEFIQEDISKGITDISREVITAPGAGPDTGPAGLLQDIRTGALAREAVTGAAIGVATLPFFLGGIAFDPLGAPKRVGTAAAVLGAGIVTKEIHPAFAAGLFIGAPKAIGRGAIIARRAAIRAGRIPKAEFKTGLAAEAVTRTIKLESGAPLLEEVTGAGSVILTGKGVRGFGRVGFEAEIVPKKKVGITIPRGRGPGVPGEFVGPGFAGITTITKGFIDIRRPGRILGVRVGEVRKRIPLKGKKIEFKALEIGKGGRIRTFLTESIARTKKGKPEAKGLGVAVVTSIKVGDKPVSVSRAFSFPEGKIAKSLAKSRLEARRKILKPKVMEELGLFARPKKVGITPFKFLEEPKPVIMKPEPPRPGVAVKEVAVPREGVVTLGVEKAVLDVAESVASQDFAATVRGPARVSTLISLQEQKPRLRTITRTAVLQEQKPRLKTILEPVTLDIQKPVVSQALITATAQAQATKTKTLTKTLTKTGEFPVFTTLTAPEFIPRLPFIPLLDLGPGIRRKRKKIKRRRIRRKTEFRPSVTAILGDIRGPPIKGFLTGFELRKLQPLPKRGKKRKKKR